MKILHIAWSGGIGGIEKHVYQLSKEMKRNGIFVEVCILNKTGNLVNELDKIGIKSYVIGLKSSLDFKGAIKFKNFISRHSYDMIHVHDRNFLSNIILLFFYSHKKIFTEHGGHLVYKYEHPWKQKLFYKLLGSQFKIIIANSNFIKETIIKNRLFMPNKVSTIYNGISLEKLTSSDISLKQKMKKDLGIENKRVVGVVCRIVLAKGIDFFLKIAKEIEKERKDIVFLIIGDGVEKKKYEEMAKGLFGVDIRFLGFRSDIGEILSVFDIFLFTSRWEPFGIVLVEAMAAGVPIVGFDIPGANEVVLSGITGYLVKPFKINEAAIKVLELLRDGDKYAEFSKRGRERAINLFSITNNYNNIMNIYNKFLSQ